MTDWIAAILARIAVAIVGVRSMAVEVDRCQAAHRAREKIVYAIVDGSDDDAPQAATPSAALGFRTDDRP